MGTFETDTPQDHPLGVETKNPADLCELFFLSYPYTLLNRQSLFANVAYSNSFIAILVRTLLKSFMFGILCIII